MNPRILKYLLDIESILSEIEVITARTKNNFDNFKEDFLIKRAAERDLEIIGEAVKQLLRIQPSLKISGAKNIISLRNFIIHAYDAVDDELIWAILQKDIPILKEEIKAIKG